MWQPCPVEGGGVLNDFILRTTNPAGGSYTFTIMKSSDGVVTETELSLTPSGTLAHDNCNAALFAQGDLWCVRCTTTADAAQLGSVSWCVRFTATSQKQSLVLGGHPPSAQGWPSASMTNYGTFQGTAGCGEGKNGPFEPMPCAGTVRNLFVHLPNAVTQGRWTIAFNYEWNDTPLSVVIDAGRTASDVTHSIPVAVGGLTSVSMIPSGTPSDQSSIMWGFEFNPAEDGQSIGTYDITPLSEKQSTVYNSVSGSDFLEQEDLVQNVIFAGVEVGGLIGSAVAVPLPDGSLEFALRRNGADTDVRAAIASNLATDVRHKVVTNHGDLLSFRTTNAGNTTVFPCAGLVFTIGNRSSRERLGPPTAP